MNANRNFIRKLRKNATLEEGMLWERLRGSKFGFKFGRQHKIGVYVVDFYCAENKLVIEIDGNPHLGIDRIRFDKSRDEYLESKGINIMRFWGSQVRNDLESVIGLIESKMFLTKPHP